MKEKSIEFLLNNAGPDRDPTFWAVQPETPVKASA